MVAVIGDNIAHPHFAIPMTLIILINFIITQAYSLVQITVCIAYKGRIKQGQNKFVRA